MEHTDKIEELIKFFLLKEEKYLSEIDLLKEQIKLLKAALFGKKSEKKPVANDRQLTFFDSIKVLPENILSDDEEIEIKPHTRKKRGRKPIPDNLPRVEVIHDIDEKDKKCECGCMKNCIGIFIKPLNINPILEAFKLFPPKYLRTCD